MRILDNVNLLWGDDLTLPINRKTISGRKVLFVDGNTLAACLDEDGEIAEEFCKQLARREPLRVVSRDSGIKVGSAGTNVKQMSKLISLHTEVKSI